MSKSNLLFKDSDVDILDQHIDDIKEKVELIRADMFKSPISDEDKLRVLDVIINFTIKKQRKVYGGYAINELILLDGNEEPIYEPNTVHDIDFYSPDPINDVMDICDELHKLNIGEVIGKEAIHAQTYSITVADELFCDVSYVPNNIYHRMPFKTSKQGIYVIHPHFMWIDYLRILTDPINSWFRVEKSYRRFSIVQKLFKFPMNLTGIDIGGSTPEIDLSLTTILNFLKNRETTITVGFYAYNYFLDQSKAHRVQSRGRGGQRTRTSKSTLKFLDVPYYEFISTDYKKDTLELLQRLRDAFPDKAETITHTEQYPFMEYTGYSTNIYCNGDIVAKIYDHNKRCTPYQDVGCKVYAKDIKKHQDTGCKVRLGTFTLTLLYNIVNIQRYRVNKDNQSKELFYAITSHLLHMRNHYFESTGKHLLDETPFKEMEINCAGKTLTPFMEKKLRILKNKKANRRYTFKYDPSVPISKRPKFVFLNSSGNKINNDKNLKLTGEDSEDELQEGGDSELSSDDDVSPTDVQTTEMVDSD